MKFVNIYIQFYNEYHIFYDEECKIFNFFYYNQDKDETECLGVMFDKVKILYDILTLKTFEENYIEIFNNILSQDSKIAESIFEFQTFPKGFWEEVILTKFRNHNVVML